MLLLVACPPPLEIVVDHLVAKQADGDCDHWRLDNQRPPGGAADTPPLLLRLQRRLMAVAAMASLPLPSTTTIGAVLLAPSHRSLCQ